MKIKIDQIRTYDNAGYRRRAACLCVRSNCESEVLLISSGRCKNLWVVPGGGLEPGEEPETTAAREVDEEAGAVGKLGRLLGVFENKERKTKTYVYVLHVDYLKDEYDDCNIRGRRWFSLIEAIERLSIHKPVQTAYFEKLMKDKEHLKNSSNCQYACLQNIHENVIQETQLSSKFIKCKGCSKWYNETSKYEKAVIQPDENVVLVNKKEKKFVVRQKFENANIFSFQSPKENIKDDMIPYKTN